MDSDLLRALCALLAVCLPLGVAWLIVARSAPEEHDPHND